MGKALAKDSEDPVHVCIEHARLQPLFRLLWSLVYLSPQPNQPREGEEPENKLLPLPQAELPTASENDNSGLGSGPINRFQSQQPRAQFCHSRC